MNTRMIRITLGHILKLEAAFMLLPCIVALIYKEMSGIYFLYVAIAEVIIGFLLTSFRKPTVKTFYLKDGCITTALGWIVLSFFGCLPFYFSGEIPHFTDALFETISGFTTTGTTILEDVEALSYNMLFWRSFTHWLGGMGVLVFLLAIIPLSGGSNINLMRAESPGPSVGKLVPKIRNTSQILYFIYFGMTVAEAIFLLIGGMPLFDAITTALGTAGTGGFGIKNDSIASYAPHLQWIITIFMILFGVNFNAYFLLFFGSIKKALKVEEVRAYFGVIFAAGAFIAFNIYKTCEGVFDAITKSFFQVASVITTTGFGTTDFNSWPEPSRLIMVLLMFVGACAGSTGGGIKISRFMIVLKNVKKEFLTYIHPKSVKKIQLEGKPVEHEVIRSVNVYFVTFACLFVLSLFIISFEGYDLITSFTAVTATINNIGPGLGRAAGNFSFFSDLSKYVFMFDMLAGRLELFPMLILFHPTIWKDFFHAAGNKVQRRRRK